MADPICPAEKMLDAQEREFDLWSVVPNAPNGPTQYEVRRGEEVILLASHRETAEYELKDLRAVAAMRAALRALAEMPMPEDDPFVMKVDAAINKNVWQGCNRAWDMAREYLLAFAAEGETS